MSTAKDLKDQIANLQRQLAEVHQREISEAVDKVRALVDEYQLSVTDVFPNRQGKSKQTARRARVDAKYRDPVSGKTWSGRGRVPGWLVGDRAGYLISTD